jgi:hypothetical protein
MASAGEQIVAAMATALNAPSNKPATTYRTRVDALEAKELPAMILYAIEEKPEISGPGTRFAGARCALK